MSSLPDGRELCAALDREIAALDDFIVLLEAEQAALIQADAEKVAELAARKMAHVAALAERARARNALLARAVGQVDAEGMERWHSELDREDASGAWASWQRLLARARKAHGLNERNGALVALHLAHTQAAAAVLAAAAGAGALLYGPDGQPDASRGGRPLGKA